MNLRRIPPVWRLIAILLAVAAVAAIRLSGGGRTTGQTAVAVALLVGLGARALLLRPPRR